MVKKLEEIIYGFMQAAFSLQPPAEKSPDFEKALELLAEHKTLRVQTFLSWPVGAQEGLRELLTNWIIVFRIAEAEGIPITVLDSWAVGASSTRLSESIVAEIRYRAPELLAMYRRRTQID